MKKSGLFVTLEGPDGAGKTSVMSRLESRLKEKGIRYTATREPGGIRISEMIREIILDPSNTEMDARTEALLYAAARRQHLVQVIEPALQEGRVVLCDRFIDSSIAYQGAGRGIGTEDVREINRFAIGNVMPELTLLLDLPAEEGLARIERNRDKGREVNRLDAESLAFHRTVQKEYAAIAENEPDRVIRIDASGTLEETAEKAWTALKSRLP
ncbi:dTMP kinase [Edaphobacillus lindanitolerans]|uniref:Thymidylate kinase n=1 Tax=Edaphobacillus lindanitolerans TaxID=550447 RepID=A0A1U7PU41_9BACI|nr:dTMP kinase [Edaphobacillus lindanitolerans]SIT93424.1 thymidylate kinase [Edaphobacillus lindanitolerans]